MVINLQKFKNFLLGPTSFTLQVDVGVIAVIFGLTLLAGYRLVIVDQTKILQYLQSQELDKRSIYEQKQARVNQIPAYKEQAATIQGVEDIINMHLNDIDVSGLILDISDIASVNGLEVEFFKLKPEIQRDFFIEKLVEFKAKGTYEELATFISDLYFLPRIFSVSNIQLELATKGKANNIRSSKTPRLSLNMIIKEYQIKKRTTSSGGN